MNPAGIMLETNFDIVQWQCRASHIIGVDEGVEAGPEGAGQVPLETFGIWPRKPSMSRRKAF